MKLLYYKLSLLPSDTRQKAQNTLSAKYTASSLGNKINVAEGAWCIKE